MKIIAGVFECGECGVLKHMGISFKGQFVILCIECLRAALKKLE